MGGGAKLSKSFDIKLSDLDYNLKNFDRRARNATKKVLQYQAASSETRMRSTAPWTDRTTNARNGLFAEVLDNGLDSWLLLFSHSVDYGFWLEVINNGEYAAVRPEFLKANREVMRRLSRIFEMMEKGR
jgi:hypothetical protein